MGHCLPEQDLCPEKNLKIKKISDSSYIKGITKNYFQNYNNVIYKVIGINFVVM